MPVNSAEPETLAPEARPAAQRRAAVMTFVAAAVIFFLAELIAAAAWTDPPYSYTYHYISNLGVRGPSEALGQTMNSPLAWVMNAGFFLFGILSLAGVALLRGLGGLRRWAALVPAAALAAGGILLALFPGSAEAMQDGTDAYHGLGAMLAIVGGNVLVIVLGCLYKFIDVPRRRARVMVALGVFGVVSLIGFLAVAGSGAGVIGLVERCAVYPFLIALTVPSLRR